MAPRDDGPEYKFKPGARCNIRQRAVLLRCSSEQDVAEWNEWRQGHPDEEIWLNGLDLTRAHLEKVNLRQAHLEGAILRGASLERAVLHGAYLQGAVLWQAQLKGANLWQAHMQGAGLWRARLERAALLHADLSGAFLREADLHDANLSNARLEGAVLSLAQLQGAKLEHASLQGADFQFALIDSSTRIADCAIDRNTDFTGVGLGSVRIEPGLTQLLEYNIRRKRWREWYDQGPPALRVLKKAFINPFWWMSDYGHSMARILLVFGLLAVGFAGIYYHKPDWLEGLNDSGGVITGLHAFYFSVVTMTTLGFGDIHARADVWQGQILLMLQVIMGYILLGALVTRLAVLFTAGGPAARFTEASSTTPEKLP